MPSRSRFRVAPGADDSDTRPPGTTGPAHSPGHAPSPPGVRAGSAAEGLREGPLQLWLGRPAVAAAVDRAVGGGEQVALPRAEVDAVEGDAVLLRHRDGHAVGVAAPVPAVDVQRD